MNKHLLPLFLCLCMLCLSAAAGPVDVETARQQATSFFRRQHASDGRRLAPAAPMRLLHTQQSQPAEAPLLYVFAPDGGEGYAVIAGDDAAPTVLGYSDTDTFNPDSLPCCLSYLLDEYGRQIAFLRSLPLAQQHTARRAAQRAAVTREKIEPLTTSKWNQRSPYNALCPIDQSTKLRCMTGCVATAMAQLMYYHRWPLQGKGSHSYECQGQTLTADFGATTYQWSKMHSTYSATTSDTDQAVATLMLHCGIAVEMDYHSSTSSAGVMADIMMQYFDYADTARDLCRDDVDEETYEQLIYNELFWERPVLISGCKKDFTGGHEFICDGYDNGYFHFNFGWGGYRDGNFRLTRIIPASTGYDFSYNQWIIYGLQPAGTEATQDGFTYQLYPDCTAAIVKGTASGDYIVPTWVRVGNINYDIVGIGNGAFKGCTALTSLTVPECVASIGDEAFSDCPNLATVTMADSPNPIVLGSNAFSAASSDSPQPLLVYLGRTFLNTSPYAWSGFQDNQRLTSLTLGEQVVCLPNNAFNGCSRLQHLHLPAALSRVGETAFMYCDALTVSVDDGNSSFYAEDGVLFQTDGATLFFYPPSRKATVYTVPDGIKALAPAAFNSAPIQQLHLPATLRSVDWASLFSYQLSEVYLHGNTPPESMADYVFPDPQWVSHPITIYVPQGHLAAYQGAAPWNAWTLKEMDYATPIVSLHAAEAPAIVGYYTLDGKPVSTPSKGVCLVRLSDGTIRKVVR